MVESTNDPKIEGLAQVVPETPKISNNTREDLALDTVLAQGVCNSSASAGLQHHHDTRLSRIPSAEGARDADDSMQAFLGTPELLIMFLSCLSTRDLTRCLTVSKHWRAVILDPKSKELRRNLFLEPVQTRAYLEYKDDADPRLYTGEKRMWHPVLVGKPSQRSKLIVEVHPIFLEGCEHELKTFLGMRCPQESQLRSVSPSTFICQPPLEELGESRYKRSDMLDWSFRHAGGITFGALLEGLDQERLDKGFEIHIPGAVLTTADVSQAARKARALAQLYNEQDSMSPNEFQEKMLQVQAMFLTKLEVRIKRLRTLGLLPPPGAH